MTEPLDFTGKRVLVIGGSSGIGNGIAHGFRAHGASVAVTGTRPDAGDYLEAEDSDFTGLDYFQLDLTDRTAADRLAGAFGPVDVLVLCQGTVRYGRQEFTRDGWDQVVDINLNSVMDAATLETMMIAPGLVPTKLTSVTTEHPERLEASLRKIPLRRMGSPEDMAGAALFLASPLSAYITGQTLVVDGGLTLS